MTRALGVQSRANWHVSRDRFPLSQGLARQWKSHISAFFAPSIDTVTTLASSFPRFDSHGHYAYVHHYYACADIVYACVSCVFCVFCVCVLRVRVCGSVHLCAGIPHFSFLIFAAHAAAVVSCLHHTVPQALKLSTLWQPRYKCSRTSSSSFCDGHGRCICVCACACHVSYRNEHSQERWKSCAGDRAIQTHTSSGSQKQPRSHGYNSGSGTTVLIVQQHQGFKLWP